MMQLSKEVTNLCKETALGSYCRTLSSALSHKEETASVKETGQLFSHYTCRILEVHIIILQKNLGNPTF